MKHCLKYWVFPALIVFFWTIPVLAQIGIPKIPKIPKPTPDSAKPDSGGVRNGGNNTLKDTDEKRLPGQTNAKATAPSFDAATFLVRVWTLVSDYSRGNEGQAQRWAPVPAFTVYGPIDSGSVINVAYTKPNGTEWFSHDCATTNKVSPGHALEIECPRDSVKQEKAITETGLFGFTVTIRNELSGVVLPLYKGSFRIASWVDNPTNQPKFSRNFVYYPKLDWKLQSALIFTKPPKDQYDTSGQLKVILWFRGASKDVFENNIVGYLFFQGKQVAATNGAGSNMVQDRLSDNVFQESSNDIHGRLLNFNANVYDKENGDLWFGIYKNPGDYEVKVLQNGKLARVVRFTVDRDGSIVDDGSASKLGSPAIFAKAEVVGEQDGTIDRNAFAVDGFYGTRLP